MDCPQPCRATAALSQQELDALDKLPQGANEINFTTLSCELEAGHAGPHLALGQNYGARARWLQWAHDWLDIAHEDHCEADRPLFGDIPGDRDMCLLPVGHSGAHSFEIARG